MHDLCIQEAKSIVPKLLSCLQQLPQCSAPRRSLTRLQASLALLLSNLHKVICIDQLTGAARHDVSQTCKDVIASAILGETPAGPVSTGMLLALRGALQVPHDSSISLPLLPQHSAELLSWLVQHHMLPAKDGPLSSNLTVVLLLAARLHKIAARDSKLLDIQVAQQLASIACR